jgi:cytochrome c oxidase cbb3-type subunit 1
MSATLLPPSGSARVSAAYPTDAEIDLSCRVPLLALFGGAAFWLVISSVFAVLSSLKFHNANFLADASWLTFGRIRPAANNAFLYGFAIPAGLGVGLWMIARLGRIQLVQPLLVSTGVKLWNFGVLVGLFGIMSGDATGFEWFDMPRYASLFLFLGYLLMSAFGLLTFYQRRQRALFISQWFLLAAFFWFPWIFVTASALLLIFPVRGATQAVLAWWYAGNILWVWLSAIGIAILFYFIPRFTRREIHSYYLALFTFWSLLLFSSWSGVPNSAPVPAWIPAASTVGTVLGGLAMLTLILNLHHTLNGRWALLRENVSLKFLAFGLLAFVLAQLLNIAGSIGPVADLLDLTWFGFARNQLQCYGFFAIVLFGAIYHIVPQLLGLAAGADLIPASVAKLARANFMLAVLGIMLVAVPFAVGGLIQGVQMANSKIPFMDIVHVNQMIIRITTLGDLLILAANLVFMLSLGRFVAQFYKARAVAAYAEATADISTAGVKA